MNPIARKKPQTKLNKEVCRMMCAFVGKVKHIDFNFLPQGECFKGEVFSPR